MNTPSYNQQAMVQARLKARARRISMLRRRVVVGALASFALAWGVIAQSGSLGSTTTRPGTSSQVAAATQVVSRGDDDEATFAGDDDATTTSAGNTTSAPTASAATPVTTSQS